MFCCSKLSIIITYLEVGRATVRFTCYSETDGGMHVFDKSFDIVESGIVESTFVC